MSPETPSALFFPMPDDAIRLLGEYGAFLKEAMPLKPKYARNLPFEVRELSASLTDERAEAFAPDCWPRCRSTCPRERAWWTWARGR